MAEKWPSLLIAEAHKFAEDLAASLIFKHPDPWCNSHESSEKVAEGTKEKPHRKKAEMDKLQGKHQGRKVENDLQNDNTHLISLFC